MIELRTSDGRDVKVDEGESCDIVMQLGTIDDVFQKDAVVSVTMSLFNKRTDEIINERENESVLDESIGTLSSAGVLRLRLNELDNVIVEPDEVLPGRDEYHVLRVKWTWISSEAVLRTGIEDLCFRVRRLREPVND